MELILVSVFDISSQSKSKKTETLNGKNLC